jgi:5-methylcytosine-specific restriction endonuclease McrA
MPDNPFYKSKEWHRLRSLVIKRAGGKCETPGCVGKGVVVDHVKSRRAGGRDELSNLRLLCRTCDNRLKEDATGQRRSGGIAVTGCYEDGSPRSPEHPWYTGGPTKHG